MVEGNKGLILILGSHAHVPYGAVDREFEKVYKDHVKPFVSTLYKFPKIQAALHYSGVLLNWIERNHPELFMLMEDMVSRRQTELLGGGFYEPMLPLIPLQDKIGQIEFLTTYLRKQFGKRPLGCWIPDPAWEQNLAGPLSSCGMQYTFLDEERFLGAGLAGADLFYPCLCEDQGKLITVFPVSRTAGAALAEKKLPQVIEDLRKSLPAGKTRMASVFPARVFAEGEEAPDFSWNRFFEDLSLSGLECLSPGKLLKGLDGLKKVYIPETVLPRRFVIEHPEAAGIYSKMIFTSVLINQLRGDKSRKQTAREELWKAQGCDLFCSSERLLNSGLRKAAYRSLLGAERITREKGKFSSSLIQFDFDLDGEGEYLFQDQKINCYIRIRGGGLFELDYLPRTWNYLDTSGGRSAFADCFLPQDFTPEELPGFMDSPADSSDGRGRFGIRERADSLKAIRFCGNENYELAELDRVRGKVRLRLPAEKPAAPSAKGYASPFAQIEIEKSFSLKKDTLTVSYNLTNRGGAETVFQFAPHIDLSFPGGADFVRFFRCRTGSKDIPLSENQEKNIETLKIQDLKNEVQIALGSSDPFGACVKPIGAGGVCQSNCIIPVVPFSLAPGKSRSLEFTLKFLH
ncbi:MAG: DUF1926 domain-containing protein [Treponema sp.]|jgi:hypothetical protein|nr:DUF1926 domain-containing protein [Treponema sp.]